MKIKFLSLLLLSAFFCNAQLTVEKIMKDPKWIGTSPSNVFWSQDSKSVFFSWNPKTMFPILLIIITPAVANRRKPVILKRKK
jgi:hypothetical protein